MKIVLEPREIVGKKVKQLREEGKTPVVCYGLSEKSTPYAVVTRDLKKILASDQPVIDLAGAQEGKQALLQEVTMDPITNEPIHADFLFVDTKHEVEHDVPLHFEGEAPAVKFKGGLLITPRTEITIKALPQDIPKSITVDISTLEAIGSNIKVADVQLSAGVTLETSGDEIVASVVEQEKEEEEKEAVAFDAENVETSKQIGKKEKEDEPEE